MILIRIILNSTSHMNPWSKYIEQEDAFKELKALETKLNLSKHVLKI